MYCQANLNLAPRSPLNTPRADIFTSQAPGAMLKAGTPGTNFEILPITLLTPNLQQTPPQR